MFNCVKVETLSWAHILIIRTVQNIFHLFKWHIIKFYFIRCWIHFKIEQIQEISWLMHYIFYFIFYFCKKCIMLTMHKIFPIILLINYSIVLWDGLFTLIKLKFEYMFARGWDFFSAGRILNTWTPF